MREDMAANTKPPILVSVDEHERLSKLAEAIADRQPDVARELAFEMDRAEVVEASELPSNVVRMGSTVTFRADNSERRVTLVYPVDADIEQARISVLTPIGAALIGTSPGQSISWIDRDGRKHDLTVIACEPPARD